MIRLTCRLGVLHNICEAVPDKCGPERDQVAVVGGPLDSIHVPAAEDPKNFAGMLHHFYKQYLSNSEAARMSWVFKRVCMEKDGAPILLVAIERVDLGGEPKPGDIVYGDYYGEL
jgi:hypothetical protein